MINLKFFKRFISVIVVFILIFESSIYIKLKKESSLIIINIAKEEINLNIEKKNENREVDDIWRLTIPVIGLEAFIVDGTDEEILDKWIGHFEITGYLEGNVCLAAHNRGYPVNYFENLKYLNLNDEIIYYYHGVEQRYIVTEMNIIRDTQVEVLEDSNENIITLITCVEDEPEYRRCVIGKNV